MSPGIFSNPDSRRPSLDSKLNALSIILRDVEQRRHLDRPAKHLLLRTLNHLIALSQSASPDPLEDDLVAALQAFQDRVDALPVGHPARGDDWTALRRAHSHCLELISSSSSPQAR